jgi:outer membrane protein assembly factor BamB
MRDLYTFFIEEDLAMQPDPTPISDDVTLHRCQDLTPLSVVTVVAPLEELQTFYLGVGQVGVDTNDHVAPIGEHQLLYVTDSDRLYAVNASDGTVHWCQQVKPPSEWPNHPGRLHPGRLHRPPPHMQFGAPRVANGVVYVCASGYRKYTYAFNAQDGALRWRTPTDGWIVGRPFQDYAVPLVRDGIVYNGTYALHEQDGTVRWRITVDTRWLSLQTLVDGTLYANTMEGIYAINVQNGEVRWHYEPDTHMPIGGSLVIDDHLLYVGTLGSADHPEKSRFYALDADTGTRHWEYPMGDSYIRAVILNESIYVSSRDWHLYALEKHNGNLRWKYKIVFPTPYTVTIVRNIVYIGGYYAFYALNSEDGTVLWHKDLERDSASFYGTPSVISGVVYLASIDESGQSMLYALDANSGVEHWRNHYSYRIALLAIAQ